METGPRAGRRLSPAAIALMLAATLPAHAADCIIDTSAAGVAFGAYDPLAVADRTALGNIVVTCVPPAANNLPVLFELDTGSSGTYATRTMASGANTLAYNLYTTAGGATVFGNGTGGSQPVLRFTSSIGGSQFRATAQVFGRLPAGQNAASGDYLDTITVTVNY